MQGLGFRGLGFRGLGFRGLGFRGLGFRITFIRVRIKKYTDPTPKLGKTMAQHLFYKAVYSTYV